MGNNFKKPEQREAWNKYNRAYSKAHYKNICIKLNLETERDIIDFLSEHGNSEFIKKSVRDAIKRGE